GIIDRPAKQPYDSEQGVGLPLALGQGIQQRHYLGVPADRRCQTLIRRGGASCLLLGEQPVPRGGVHTDILLDRSPMRQARTGADQRLQAGSARAKKSATSLKTRSGSS